MSIEGFFADTVAAGWQPRNPCTDERELARLEQSIVRGDCIHPLLQAGDTIYVDRSMRPAPGDVVSFALGQRGADAQNSDLPAGQSPWVARARWCKLYGIEHGFQMLYDRHGNAATATLLTCEDPDDVPVLHPVRNVMRNGRLLFGGAETAASLEPSDLEAAQVGFNAATIVSTAIVLGPVNIAHAHSSPPPVVGTTIASISVSTEYASTVVITVTGFYQNSAASVAGMYSFQYGVTTNSGASDYGTSPVEVSDYIDSSGDVASGPISQEITFAQAADTTVVYYLNALASPASSTLQALNVTMKAEQIIR